MHKQIINDDEVFILNEFIKTLNNEQKRQFGKIVYILNNREFGAIEVLLNLLKQSK